MWKIMKQVVNNVQPQTVPKGCVLFGLSVTEGHGYGRVRWGTFPLTFSPQNRCQIRVPF